MRFVLCLVAMVGALAFGPSPASTNEHRSRAVARKFQREHPCPSTGRTSGACPGYWKDHIVPLACRGPDTVSNLQWHTTAGAQMHAFSGMRRLSSRQTSDEALEPKPVNRKSNPSSPPQRVETNSDATRCLPASRISETHETTDGSAELKFRIQFPPAESHANHRFLSTSLQRGDGMGQATRKWHHRRCR